MGAVVILVGACIAMYPPIFHLFQARAARAVALDDDPSSGYDDDSLRGGNGDYAIVEGEENSGDFCCFCRGCPGRGHRIL